MVKLSIARAHRVLSEYVFACKNPFIEGVIAFFGNFPCALCLKVIFVLGDFQG